MSGKRMEFSVVKHSFEKEGYTLLTERYVNNQQKLRIICPEGHESYISWGNWNRGRRCRTCSFRKRNRAISEGNKLGIEFVREQFEKEGYILKTKEYIGSKQRFEFVCDRGHENTISYNDWRGGCRCSKCYEEDRSMLLRKTYTAEELEEIDNYTYEVRRLSNDNYGKYYYFINPENLKRGRDYHLDHIYSVMDGFKNNVLPEIIAHPYNLRILPAKENIAKNYRSDITLDELYDLSRQCL